MMSSLIEMVVYLICALLAVKMVFFRKDQQTEPKDKSVSWKLAVESMSIMETRLGQLQERDLKQQERIWALEDLNRDLQSRLARCTKELLRARPPSDSGPTPLDDEEDDDFMHSIPPNR
jgi:hypothetical protein